MASDVLAVADRLWNGEISTVDLPSRRPHRAASSRSPTAWASAPPSPTSRPSPPTTACVLVDTGSAPLARVVHDDIRTWSPARLHTAVYSHGHIDHVFGVPVWEEEAAAQGWAAPEVVAHHALPARFDRYIFTAGYNTIINRRQFGFTDLHWPTEYRYPDRTYHDTLDLVGRRPWTSRCATRRARPTTTPSPGSPTAGCCAAATSSSGPPPTPATPRRCSATRGSGRPPCAACSRSTPSSSSPATASRSSGPTGSARPSTDTADLLDSLVDQTLAVMNAGGRLDDAIHTVRAPAELADRPYLQPGLRRARVHRAHGLAPVRRLVGRQPGHAQAGTRAGPGRPSWPSWPGGRARWPTGPWSCWPLAGDAPDAERRQADGALRLAGHLAEHAWLAAPRRRRRPAGAPARSSRPGPPRATSTMARGVFTWAANESAPAAAIPAPTR